MEGYIFLHRQLTENEFWFAEKFTKAQAWIDLLLLASHKSRTVFVRGIEINLIPGELCYSQLSLAKRWKWSDKTVKKFLALLKERGMIDFRGGKVSTIISILNWKKYQISTEQNQPIKSVSEAAFLPSESEQLSEQTPNNFRTNNNVNNVKNINRRKIKNIFSIENRPENLNGQLFYENKFFFIDMNFRNELLEKFAGKNLNDDILKTEFYKMETWLEANGAKKNYKLFIVNWLSKVKPALPTAAEKFNFNFIHN